MKFERINPLTGEVASSAEAVQAGDISAIGSGRDRALPPGRRWVPTRAAPC
jgi:hypothetical protein